MSWDATPYYAISHWSLEWHVSHHVHIHSNLLSHYAFSFFTIVISYIFLGALYRRLVLNHRGIDMIPRFSLHTLSDLYRTAKDFFDRTPNRFQESTSGRRWNQRNRSHYQALSAEEEEEPLHAGDSRFSIEDEEERQMGIPPPPLKDTRAAEQSGSIDTSAGVIRL